MSRHNWLVGVDIGGTFTDLCAVHPADGRLVAAKVLTTPADPLQGVFDALEAAREKQGIVLPDIDHLVHATTLAINTLIERKGATVGLLTTRGFRDVIEMGREDRYDLYDLHPETLPPMVPRARRLPVVERVNARGDVVVALDEESAREAASRLKAQDVTAIAICFLHSYANPVNEVRGAAVVRQMLPSAFVSVSSDVAPIIREYERFIATTINAYIGPRLGFYISRLDEALNARGFRGIVTIMKSDGGMFFPNEARTYPVRLLESGPAAGVIAAGRTAVETGLALAVAFDMGGTTAKGCVMVNGEPVVADELEVSRVARFVKGSGLPVRLPSLDLVEIGAGGGSIAWINDLGLLQVGPSSASAEPGPACYGRGGERPTVTDADVLLGYVNPEYFVGGSMKLSAPDARGAIETELLTRTGTADVTAAAWAIHDLVNENMARAIRFHCLEHGVDPAQAALVATGGAGPVHAAHVARKLNAGLVVCPAEPGVASALGLLVAPQSIEQTTTDIVLLDSLTPAEIGRRLGALEGKLRATVTGSSAGMLREAYVYMRVRGQAYEVRVRLPEPLSLEALRREFRAEYTNRFARPPVEGKEEIVSWSVRLVGRRELNLQRDAGNGHGRAGLTRNAYFGPGLGWRSARTLPRASLGGGGWVEGPLLVEEETTTIVVPPGAAARLDGLGNVHIRLTSDEAPR